MIHPHDDPPHVGGLRPYRLLAQLVIITVVGEWLIGFGSRILALMVDAYHTLGDGFAIGIVAWFQATRHKRSIKSNARLERTLRVVIGLLIIGAGIHAGLESFERWQRPNEISGLTMVGTAFLCAGLNQAMLFVLGLCPCRMDKHLRSHVKSDIWISRGVAIGGLLVILFGLWWIEPAASSAISLLVIWLGIQVLFDLHEDKIN